ncbi:hypothetical protein SFC65_19055 [Priestia filamentosa]|uniref:hypothetical protein n=1 Tax=Priestia filamentosa TaxID=1402861 RepID=UPI0039822D85
MNSINVKPQEVDQVISQINREISKLQKRYRAEKKKSKRNIIVLSSLVGLCDFATIVYLFQHMGTLKGITYLCVAVYLTKMVWSYVNKTTQSIRKVQKKVGKQRVLLSEYEEVRYEINKNKRKRTGLL